MTPRPYSDYLEDIRREAERAIGFLGALSAEQLIADQRTAYAIIHALEVMGEAAKRIPPDIRDRFPDIPWTSMAGIRDKLIHDYLTVEIKIVWETVAHHLAPLIVNLEATIAILRSENR